MSTPQSSAQMQIQSDTLPTLSLGTGYDRGSLTDSMQNPLAMPKLPNMKFPPPDFHFHKNYHQERHIPSPWGLTDVPPLPDSQRKVLENILRTNSRCLSSDLLAKKSMSDGWSEDELDSLWIGVRRHGHGNWETMLKDPKLRFSLQKTSEDLSFRWEEELVRIFDGPADPGLRSSIGTKAAISTFPNLSDGIIARALNGSRFNSPFGFPSSNDLKLGFSDLPKLPGQFGSIPSWHSEQFLSQVNGDASAGHLQNSSSNSPNSFRANGVGPNGVNCSSNFGLNLEDEQVSHRKLPSFLPPHNHMNRRVAEESVNMGCPPNQDLGLSVIQSATGDFGGCSVSTQRNLPHWLRDAVGTSKRTGSDLPPMVSALAHSVRLIYGDERPAIPPFMVPGQPPCQPQDPRQNLKSLKKKRAKTHDHQVDGNNSPRKRRKNMDSQTTTSFFQPQLEAIIDSSLVDSAVGTSSAGNVNAVVYTSPEELQIVASCDASGPQNVSVSSGLDELPPLHITGLSDQKSTADNPSIQQDSNKTHSGPSPYTQVYSNAGISAGGTLSDKPTRETEA